MGLFARMARAIWSSAASTCFHTVDVSPWGAKLRPNGFFQPDTLLQLEFINPDGRRLHVSRVFGS